MLDDDVICSKNDKIQNSDLSGFDLVDYGTAIELEQMKLVLSKRKVFSILELYVGV